MDELKAKAGELTESVSDYLRTYYDLKVIKLTDKVTSAAASAIATMTVLFLSIFVLFFSGIALGIWFGHLLNNTALGYLLVAGLFLLVIIIVVAARKKLVFPMIRDRLLNKIYKQHD